MSDEVVAIKGVQDGLLITLSTSEEWLHVTGALAQRIDEQAEFFAGAKLTIELGERPVPKHELSGLKALLERRGMDIAIIMSDSKTTIEAAQALDMRVAASTPQAMPPELRETLPIDPEEKGVPGVLLRRTLRSGRVVHSEGHVVVFGDVNPGAEIVAGGDVFIWGRLRGNVHAGAYGNEQAVVCALDMSPNQLRIASHITTSPPGKRRRPRPEIALIHENTIIVQNWDA